MSFEKRSIKSIAQLHSCVTFAATVPVLLPVRSACGSFFLNKVHKNTPSMALCHVYFKTQIFYYPLLNPGKDKLRTKDYEKEICFRRCLCN